MNQEKKITEIGKSFPCILCKKRTKPKDRKKCESSAIRRFLRKNFLVEANSNDILCTKCRHLYHGNQQKCQKKSGPLPVSQPPQTLANPSSGISSPPSISLPIHRTPSSHAYCFICKRPGPKLVVVTSSARFTAFLQKEVIIPSGSRCCPSHVEDGEFRPGALDNLHTLESTLVNRTTILELIQKIRNYAIQNSTSRFSFEPSSMNTADYTTLTGISKENFEDLHSFISNDIRNTQNRGTRMSLGIFLLKLRSGMSNQLLATIFGISKSSLCRAIRSVRAALMKSFVPHFIGLHHISRENFIENHTRPLAQELFGDFIEKKAIAVFDGTYIYIQKSNNFNFQRKSYSLHKGRPLVKPMVVTSTDGYFLTVLGPYLARNNDATILNHMLHTNVEDLKGWFQEDDVFIVDRGFRDSLDVLDEMGIRAEMPRLLSRGQKQMTTSDANASRLVTKVCSSIFKVPFLSHVLPTNQVPFISDYVRIVCAISNRYLKPLSTGNDDDDLALAAKMRYLSTKVNSLKTFVEENSLDKRSVNWEIASDSFEFPKLSEEEIRNLTCGVYQLKLSPSYIQEYLEGDVDILIHREFNGLLRVKLQSRHISSRQYLLWIQFSESEIIAWYCRCRAGARVVGVCSHVAAVVWFLAIGRHDKEAISGVQDWSEFVTDATIIDESDDSDDSVIEE